MSITALSHLGALSISGIDAQTFLQGQVTTNMNDITAEQSRLGAHCNLKGRMQSLFRIVPFHHPENIPAYLLIMPLTMVPLALTNFKKYALFSKVQCENISEKINIYGMNETSITEVTQILQMNIDTLPVEGCITQPNFTVCRVPGMTARYELYSTIPFALETSPSDTWELQDIQAGLPMVYPNTVDTLLPHHVNLVALQGIGFNKGCYLGQEVIARMHYKGKIKKHMYHATAALTTQDALPEPGTPVIIAGSSESEAPGVVVRASHSPLGCELLVVLDEEYADMKKAHLYSTDGPLLY